MDDFNSYAKKSGGNKGNGAPDNIMKLVTSLANKFDGKSQTELIKAIYDEAKRGKEQGTLSNADIDNFVNMLSPMIDAQKRKILFKVAEEIKKI
ncbi:MAG: hypothetical protein IKA11_01060 [Clostridia bacterium]|nr:hypothetical protein [Clostridia bacterium]